MLVTDKIISDMLESPVRKIRGRVEILEGSTLLEMCKCGETLKEFSIERVCDNTKFFGYGISQRLNVKFLDKNREKELSTANTLDIAFGVESDYIHPFPYFHVSQVRRDEKDNELSVTAYDVLYGASKYKMSDIPLTDYTIGELAVVCGGLLGVAVEYKNVNDDVFNTDYREGANYSGSENLREVLDAIAEATQTIYYINSNNVLTFRRLTANDQPVYTISKANYFNLDVSENKRLAAIAHTTELGDNVTAKATYNGTTQYIRENPFYTMRDDINTLLDNALTAVGGLTVGQFDCQWRGNFLLEIGDRLWIELKDKTTQDTFYLLDDVITYDGTLSAKTQWSYAGSESESETTLTNIGDTIKNTYARVDKANQEIALVVNRIEENANNIAALKLNADSITASVTAVKEETVESLTIVNDNIGTLTQKVDAQITAEDVTFTIQQELNNGVSKVETATGFTFNEEGLKVSKTDSELSTQITDNGMTVYRAEEPVLIANNDGVDATNLHATTYLIVGANSRFEDYGDNRTGCFWIGSVN